MSDALVFDFDAVTPRMLLDFKDKTGVALMSTLNDKGEIDVGSMSEELVAGLIWLALRMSGRPDATWDDALDTPLSSLDLQAEEPADPTTAS